MRISTTQIYTEANRSMMEGQRTLADIQAKIASGKNFTSLAEDPVGANRVVNLKRELAQLDVYQKNIDSTRQRLDLEEITLDNFNIALDRARELSIQAANNTLTDSDRKAISYEMEELLNYLTNLSNTRNAKGEYIFSGSKGTTPTYALVEGQYLYQGDATGREIQIGSSVYVDSSDPGRTIFESIPGAADISLTGALSGAVVDYAITDELAFQQLMASVGDIQLSVSRIDPEGDPVYSLLGSGGQPIQTLQNGPALNVPYTDADASPNTLTVEIKGARLTLALPPSEALSDAPRLEVQTNVVANGVATFALSGPLADEEAQALVAQDYFETYGPLRLDVTETDIGGGSFTYIYAVLDSQDNPVVDTDGNLLPGSSGSWTTPAETAPLVILTPDAAFELSFTPVEAAGTQAYWSQPAVSYSVSDLAQMQPSTAVLGDMILEVTLTDEGDLLVPSDKSDDVYSYRLVDADGNTVIDQQGEAVTGTFTGVGSPVSAELGGYTLSFTPFTTVGALNVPVDQASLSLAPATQFPDLSVIGEEKQLIADLRLADSAAFTAFMTGTDLVDGAGDLSVAVTYDYDGGYTWSLQDRAGTQLQQGSYREPAQGRLSALIPTMPSVAVPLEFSSSFAIEVNGQRSGLLTLDTAPPASGYTDINALTADLQSLIDNDSVLSAAGISVGYDLLNGLTFTAGDNEAELQFAAVEPQITTNLGISNTSNRITLGLAGAELDLNLPLEQMDSSTQLRYDPPLAATLKFEQDDTNIFNALQEAVTAMRRPAQYSTDALDRFNTSMELILNQLNAAQGQVNDTIANLGSRLNALDRSESSNIDFKLMTDSTLSAVEDLDYASASTELARKQLALEAAYASFAKIQGLSLFDYIG